MTIIVLLGEGDFSFTHSLSLVSTVAANWLRPHTSNPKIHHIHATSLDSRNEVIEKYPSFVSLKFPPFVSVHHNVNALELSSHSFAEHADFIIWNHPHLGIEQSDTHFQLLCHFFHSLASIAGPSTSVILSFLTGQIGRWRVLNAAKRSSFYLARTELFDESMFPGYSSKRNMSGDSFKSSRARDNWDNDLTSHFLFFRRSEVESPEWELKSDSLSKTQNFPQENACTECNKSFRSAQGLKTHSRQVHELKLYSEKDRVECLICKKVFHGTEAVDMHMKNAHGELTVTTQNEQVKKQRVDTPDSIACEVCGSTEKDHISEFGRNRRIEVLTCRVCEKEFKSQRAMNQHTNVVHSPNISVPSLG